MIKPEYLGDGVYATAKEDGSIMLTTGDHNQLEADNVIFLEPEGFASLDRYRVRMKESE